MDRSRPGDHHHRSEDDTRVTRHPSHCYAHSQEEVSPSLLRCSPQSQMHSLTTQRPPPRLSRPTLTRQGTGQTRPSNTDKGSHAENLLPEESNPDWIHHTTARLVGNRDHRCPRASCPPRWVRTNTRRATGVADPAVQIRARIP